MLQIDAAPPIRFNSQRMRNVLRPYLLMAMEKATDELLKNMQFYAKDNVVGNGPGKPSWRDELANDLKRLYVEEVDSFIEGAVGADAGYGEGSPWRTRAMLIAYGGGSAAIDPETHGSLGQEDIHAGPPGRVVWNENLDDQIVSESSEHPMPTSYNQPGNLFPDVAAQELLLEFNNMKKQILGNIPADILQQCFTQ